MAISYPRTDIFSPIEFVDQKFNLRPRQELSRQASGAVRGKDLGSAIWIIEYLTQPLENDDMAVEYEAILNSLDGVIKEFYAGDLRRPYPKNYPTGAFTDSGTISSVVGNTLALKTLPAGFVITRGDYFHFNYGSGPSRALHQAMETITANGSGVTGQFEVRPHVRTGAVADIAVTFKKPTGKFNLQADSISTSISDGFTAISFKAAQVL